MELATPGCIHWHNNELLHCFIGDLPPAEFEEALNGENRQARALAENKTLGLYKTQDDSQRCAPANVICYSAGYKTAFRVKPRSVEGGAYAWSVKEKSGRKNKIVLSVPGGLAGQLFAVAYGAWISQELGKTAHIQFHDVGTKIAKFALGNLLETPRALNLGLSYSQELGNWPPALGWQRIARNTVRGLRKNGLSWKILRGVSGVRAGYRTWRKKLGGLPEEKDFSVITKTRLKSSQVGEVIVGYPTDYQIVEEAWVLLSEMIRESNMPDFAHNCGLEESVAIHWRLGDYVQNETHGAVGWSSLETCLRNADSSNLPVKIFTDSPEVARAAVGNSLEDRPHQYISSQIWADLFGMTRSKIFIGTHSGVSVLAAMALRHANENSRTWLPNKWFAKSEGAELFFPAKKTFRNSSFYHADLVTDSIPI